MRLHYFPNTIAVAAAIALEEAGLPYEAVKVDFTSGAQQSPEYLAINPKGRVPVLEVDGAILTEAGAILDYIAGVATIPLLPSDPFEAAQARSLMFYLASTMHVNHAHKLRGNRWADKDESHADMAAKVPETMTASARYVEDEALKGPLTQGDTFCVADAYLYTVCRWLPGDGVDLGGFPKITAFMQAMEARPSVKAVADKGITT